MSVNINKDTVLCISVAARPSNFGTTVHNKAYQACGLNFLYKAFGISDIAAAMTGVRALGIRGCSVSMPFKESVIKYLDRTDDTAANIGAVNTVVNEDGRLVGYNTDAYGAQKALEEIEDMASKKVLMLGAGGVAKAVLYALRELEVNEVIIANRTSGKADMIAGETGYQSVSWNERSQVNADVIINATCLGMYPDVDKCPIDKQAIENCSAVMDVVTNPMESLLIKTAKQMNKAVVPGYKMCIFQAAMQFQLYTGVEPPLKVMESIAMDIFQKT